MRRRLALLLALVTGCSEGAALSETAERGRAVYVANCTACHAPDPNADGALGPAVAGSSRELLEARLMRAEYPPGYTPKRSTRVMVPLPQLEGELDLLHAYLAEAARARR